MLLSEQAYKKIDREIAKFPAEQRQSAVMASLAIAQDEKGWLSPDVMEEIAAYLGMPAVAVQEVATFYNMFNTQPVGQFKKRPFAGFSSSANKSLYLAKSATVFKLGAIGLMPRAASPLIT